MGAPVKLLVDGIEFPSISAYARHCGVVQSVAHMALERGTLANVGKGRNFLTKKPTWLDGVKFNSIAGCAKSINVPDIWLRGYIRRAKARGETAAVTPYGLVTWTPPTGANNGDDKND